MGNCKEMAYSVGLGSIFFEVDFFSRLRGDYGSYQSKTLIMFQDQLHVLFKLTSGLIFRKEQYIETSMGSWQVTCVWMPLDVELQSLQAVNRHPICSCHESQEILLVLITQFVQKFPKIPYYRSIFSITSLVGSTFFKFLDVDLFIAIDQNTELLRFKSLNNNIDTPIIPSETTR